MAVIPPELLARRLLGLMNTLFVELEDFQKMHNLGGVLKSGAAPIGASGAIAWINYLPQGDPDEDVLVAEVDINPLRMGRGHSLGMFTGWSLEGGVEEYVTGLVIDEPGEQAFWQVLDAAFAAHRQEMRAGMQAGMLRAGAGVL